ncbi:OmpW/AlkL family protein [Pseudomonas sp. GT1P32]
MNFEKCFSLSSAYRACMLACSLVANSQANADETKWWMHMGPGFVSFDESLTLKMAGHEIPGAEVNISGATAAIFELGYRFAPSWSASFTFGTPPTSNINAQGAVKPAGELGKVQYAPAVFAVQRWFDGPGTIRPYIGAGAVYFKILSSKDGAIDNLEIKDGWGSALQAGFEVPIQDSFSFFFDVKKTFIRTSTQGTLTAAGNAPITANVRMDPLVIHTGISLAF